MGTHSRGHFPLWKDLSGDLVTGFESAFLASQATIGNQDPGGWLWFGDLPPETTGAARFAMPFGVHRILQPDPAQDPSQAVAVLEVTVDHAIKRYRHSGTRLYHDHKGHGGAALVIDQVEAFTHAGAGTESGHGVHRFQPMPAVLGFVGSREYASYLLLAFALSRSLLDPQGVATALVEAGIDPKLRPFSLLPSAA